MWNPNVLSVFNAAFGAAFINRAKVPMETDPQALSTMVVVVNEKRYGNPKFFDYDLKEVRATNAEMVGYPWNPAMHFHNHMLVGRSGFPDEFIHYGAWGTKFSERTGKFAAIFFEYLG